MSRQMTEYLARARHMPPQVLAQKVAQMVQRKVRRTLSRNYYKWNGSFSDRGLKLRPSPMALPEIENFEDEWIILEKAVSHVTNHEFDLLGSGWQKVAYGTKPIGLLGSIYPSNPKRWTEDQIKKAVPINYSNRKKSEEILFHLSDNYTLIDWQLDFKSGYRWDNDQWWEQVPYGHKPGVDIKVPWELGRMQHLPWLAYASQKTGKPLYFEEFQNQILDFIATNPPRFGVNWKCPMDVAIRGANWVLAYNLFQKLGFSFETQIEKIVADSLFDHGLFIEQNFEKGTDFRGNHYLADIAGLTFIAFALSNHPRVDHWKKLCKAELINEAEYQFHAVGSNFEGSTAYHRLSSEMLYYPLLYVSLQPGESSFLENHQKVLDQLAGMAEFAKNITKPDGQIVQVGDNDSGRFFKLSPAFEESAGDIRENHLKLQHLGLCVDSLFGKHAQSIESSLIEESLKLLKKSPFRDLNDRIEKHRLQISKVIQYSPDEIRANVDQIKTYRFDLPEFSTKNIQAFLYEDFGLAIFKAPNFFLSFRCGPVGQLGRGGHDHNDQLSIELFYQGKSLVQDPGTFLYTAAPKERNRYRSNLAHHCPQFENREMGEIDKALFFINKAAAGEILEFQKDTATGLCRGFGTPVKRKIILTEGELIVEDSFFSKDKIVDLSEFSPPPYSMAYGERSF